MKVGDFEGIDVCVEVEKERACGYRKPSSNGVGIYLVGGFALDQCERLPFPLETCPTCGCGVKFSRGFTWITPADLFDVDSAPICTTYDPETGGFDAEFEEGGVFTRANGETVVNPTSETHDHENCYMCNPSDKAHGLLWVGKKTYTTYRFMAEAMVMGVSRKIGSLPNDFVLGETIVFLAHVDGVRDGEPGVFCSFKPTGIDLVIDDAEDIPGVAKRIAKRAQKRNAGGTIRIVEVK